MNDKLIETFDRIHADEELKNNTRAFLAKKTREYKKAGIIKYRRLVSAAACLLFLLLGGRWLYFTPTATISIDINPSIELGINRFNRVISVNSYNDDGQDLADSLKIRFADYTSAVQQIMDNKDISALLSGDGVMTIVITGPNGNQTTKILSGVESCTKNQGNTHCYCAHAEDVEEAHAMGLSYGKYMAFLELRALDPDITPEDIQDMTMREILELKDLLSSGSDDGSNNGSENDTQINSNGGNGHHGGGNGRHHGNGRGHHWN